MAKKTYLFESPYTVERSVRGHVGLEVSNLNLNLLWNSSPKVQPYHDPIKVSFDWTDNLKFLYKDSNKLNRKKSFLGSLGRFLEHEKEGQKIKIFKQRVDNLKALLETDQCSETKLVMQKTLSQNHRDLFIPSDKLLNLIADNSIPFDEIFLKKLKKFFNININGKKEEFQKNDCLKTTISDRIEGFFVNIVQREALHEGHVQKYVDIAKNGQILPKICAELVDRLGLNPYDPHLVLDCLYEELSHFASVPRNRDWGRITFYGSKITLEINPSQVFPINDLNKIANDMWY